MGLAGRTLESGCHQAIVFRGWLRKSGIIDRRGRACFRTGRCLGFRFPGLFLGCFYYLVCGAFRYGRLTHHGQFVNIKSGRVTPLAIDPEAWKRFGYDENAKPKRRSKAAKK